MLLTATLDLANRRVSTTAELYFLVAWLTLKNKHTHRLPS